jgi:GNAT superfamily N-acetyltransferase
MQSETNDKRFIQNGAINEIGDLRNQYLDTLPQAQEYYLELKIKNAAVFTILSNGNRAGYFILSDDHTLLEYYVIPNEMDHVDEILGEIIHAFNVVKALCKSFDHTLLSCCMRYQKSVSVGGILFREYHEKYLPPLGEDIIVRFAGMEDEMKIVDVNEEVFDYDAEVHEYILGQKILLFEKGGELLGFGIFSQVIEGRPDFDIGMLVCKKFRRQGYGSLIIRTLVNYCRKKGWHPVAGCGIGNVGSRRCLENNGFAARYRLLTFSF